MKQRLKESKRMEGQFTGNEVIRNSSTKGSLLPYRVYPGGLSVSRTIGDIESKLGKYSGIPGVVIPVPDIYKIDITDECDFILLGSDGVFDKLTNREIIDCAMKGSSSLDVHKNCANSVDNVIKLAAARDSYDNLTVIIIGMKDYYSFEPMTKRRISVTKAAKLEKPILFRTIDAQSRINKSPPRHDAHEAHPQPAIPFFRTFDIGK
jgi:serine/threonine protein phosphatase PrpC